MSIKISKCSSPLSDICRIRTTVRMHKWYPELSTTKVFITINQCLSLFMTIFGNEHLTALLQQTSSMKECFEILIVILFLLQKNFSLLNFKGIAEAALNLLKLAYMYVCVPKRNCEVCKNCATQKIKTAKSSGPDIIKFEAILRSNNQMV